ncbi:CPBP family intramembrane glutamic endopeptidase [Leifsonia shinshuensis]|uniref:CPBP family intramembrane glutamic endopeptidase n=1 Tax=Leifsonia shinshuensis TaxID=150026 RepID=UPI002854DC46|nr:CPBP family intramembrane glutamic endopeptidase [Leifsonia shinshuensis]MDR6972461.1 membrane protease YdiL (CAAX protease family) [Leifsonia shinshuensis]
MRTQYHFEAGPVRNGFYSRLTRLPAAVYVALGTVGAFALASLTIATGTLSDTLLKPLKESNPELGSLLGMLATFALFWVVFLVWAVPNRFRASGMSRHRIGMFIPVGLLLGVLMSAATTGIKSLVFGSRFTFDPGPLGTPMFWLMGLALLLAFSVQGGAEELIFRSMVPAFLARKANALTIVIVMSVAFSAAHFAIAVEQPLVFLYTFLLGVFFGLLVLASNSLWFAIAAHGAFNFGSSYLVQVFPPAPGGFELAPYLGPALTGLLATVVMLVVLQKTRPGWHRESLRTLTDPSSRDMAREGALA